MWGASYPLCLCVRIKMEKLKIVIPKGRIFDNVADLLISAGIYFKTEGRSYRPEVENEKIDIKIMKPQNIPKLVEMGARDIGFTGYDWIKEEKARVSEIMDLGFDPVKIVCAVPAKYSIKDMKKRKIIVASEYENISKEFLKKKKYKFEFLRTYGATEVFPPDDADMIIDNTSTGITLIEHNLKIVDTVMESSTRFIANKEVMKKKKKEIDKLKMLFKAVLDARKKVLLEMNVPKDKLTSLVNFLPCMRSPTVAPLYKEEGYAVKIAVEKSEVLDLIPKLKKYGARDILEYEISKVVL
jgi:ATP phosphoribosyltransferase